MRTETVRSFYECLSGTDGHIYKVDHTISKRLFVYLIIRFIEEPGYTYCQSTCLCYIDQELAYTTSCMHNRMA